MDKIKAEVCSALAGKASNREIFGGVRCDERPSLLRYNVTYIVAAVLVRESDDGKDHEILMMQEAKASCRGLWYLPAGRLEDNETLVDGVKREVLEETGLLFEPNAMLVVESQWLQWLRFTFTGYPLGGKLKTESDSDKESLQAQWISWKQLTSTEWQNQLRAPDIMPLIRQTLQWHKEDKEKKIYIVPSLVPLTHCFVKIVLVEKIAKDSTSSFRVYVGHSSSPSIPLVCASRIDSLVSVCREGLKSFGYKRSIRIVGLCGVEHDGSMTKHVKSDGLCLTVLVISDDSEAKAQTDSDRNCWVEFDDKPTCQLIERLMLPNGSISICH